MALPYAVLERKRRGLELEPAEIGEIVRGAVDGSWSDPQLSAFLMAAAIRGLTALETASLTQAMLASGEEWRLAAAIPNLCDKHSTGGVGDKVTLILGPLLAACDVPTAMLVGRGLGHTGGTADKLECVPGLGLELDRARSLELVRRTGLAIGIATGAIAPADRKLYALRDATATIDSLPLIVASILSKKLALGPAAVVFDVKTGEGAFLTDSREATELARRLVGTLAELGTRASALVTDMSQPLGRAAGNAIEVRESLETLEGRGPSDLVALTLDLAVEAAQLTGADVDRGRFERALASGAARERFDRWAELQGADPAWLAAPELPLAPEEHVLTAATAGVLARVKTRELGLLLVEAGAGRARPGDPIDPGVSLLVEKRLGEAVEAGEPLARLYLRRPDPALAERFRAGFEVGESGEAPPLIHTRIDA